MFLYRTAQLLVLLLLAASLTLCVEDYYKLLNIDRGASDREIKKAYRTLSKKFHPDKNPGNDTAAQRFVEIAEAYESLSDPELRKIYDQYGHEGVKQHKQGHGQGGGGDPFDLFSRFFGGSGHFGRGGQGGVRRGPGKEARIEISLHDFYTGAEHEFSIDKQQICEDCEGSGSADGTTVQCDQCGGRGMVIQKHMLAPGIFQQMQAACDKCGGKGKMIKTPCKVCGGSRVVNRQSSHVLHIEKGMPDGVRVTYENEADESPDWEAGDLIVNVVEAAPKLDESDHEGLRNDGVFMRRKGRDLFWKEVLSLREAWMGDWTRQLVHLDGHNVTLSRKRGEVVQPHAVEIVAGQGMPFWLQEQDREHAGAEEYGNLIVEYEVVLPDKIDKAMEKDFWALWEKWRKKIGVKDLGKELGRPEIKDPAAAKKHEEL